ncbi:MAG: EAL domain-containing protein [Nitrospirota bacterium]|nr:EAL domain-containing protein [Nitrospirota bacterium]
MTLSKRGSLSLPEKIAMAGVGLLVVGGGLLLVFLQLSRQASRLDDRIKTGAQVLSTIDSTDVALQFLVSKRKGVRFSSPTLTGWLAQVHSEMGSLAGLPFPWSSTDRVMIGRLDRAWGNLFNEMALSGDLSGRTGEPFGTVRYVILVRKALLERVVRTIDRMDRDFHRVSRTIVAVEAGIAGVGMIAFSLFALSVILYRRTFHSLDRISVVKSYLSAILEAVPYPLVLKDSRGRWLRVNKAALALFGLEDGSWENRTDQEIGESLPHYREVFDDSQNRDRKTLESGEIAVSLESLRKSDGSVVQFEITRIPLKNSDGSSMGIVVSSYDLTRRLKEAREILKLKAINEALSEVDEFILGIPDREGLYEFVCRAVVSHFENSLECRIGERVGGSSDLRWVAFSGDQSETSEPVSLSEEPLMEGGKTLSAEVLRTGRTQIWNGGDSSGSEMNPLSVGRPYREGVRSAAALPFLREGRITGVLEITSSEEGFFISEIRKLFENIARNISFALDNRDRESRRRQSEESRKQMASLYEALSRINHLTAEIPSPESLYQETVRIAVETGDLPLGWIGLLEETKRLRFVAMEGPAKDYVDGLVITSDPDEPEGWGPGGQSLRSDEPVIFRDFLSDQNFEPWRERAIRFGLRSSANFSFRRGGKIVGAMGLYQRRSHAFFPEQIDLFRQFAETLSFALDNWDREERRKNDESQMALAASVALNTQEGVVIADPEMRILTVNQAFTNLTGHSELDSVGKPLEIIRTEHLGMDFWQDILQAVSTEGFWKGEIAVRAKEGSLRQELLNISVVRDREGKTTHHVAVFTDISQIKAAQLKLEYLSLHDPLTGLPNRRAFGDRIAQGLKAARRHQEHIGVAILDLDGFKEVNDRFGHEAGDRFLVEVAARLKAVLRENDVLARMGGDEFGLLLGGIRSPLETGDILDRFIHALQFSFRVDDYAITLSGSLGIALYPEDGKDSETLLSHADLALYKAKERGKNRWVSYEPALSERLETSSRVRLDLRYACDVPEELFLHYQPQVDIRTGDVRGFEALLRWNHPEKGLLYPEDFIGVAETDAPLISLLGRRVLEEVLSQLGKWEADEWTYPVSVNIGALHFLKPGFLEEWNSLWMRFPGVPRCRIRLEITEGVAMHDPARTRALVENLREQGTEVILDSFGSGFSSLTEFQNLPVSGIRIDRALTRTLLSDSHSIAVISGVAIMCRMLDVDLVLKGVENIEQGILFMAVGGHLVQGFSVGQPMPAASVPGWIESFSLPPDWNFWADLSWPPREIGLLREALAQKRKFREWMDNPGGNNECLHGVNHRCFWSDWISGEGKERFAARPEFQKMVTISDDLHRAISEMGDAPAQSVNTVSSLKTQPLLYLHRELIRLLRQLIGTDVPDSGLHGGGDPKEKSCLRPE